MNKVIPDEYRYIWLIAKNVPIEGIIQKLQNTIIQKDKSGCYCYQFAKHVPNANVDKSQNAIITKLHELHNLSKKEIH